MGTNQIIRSMLNETARKKYGKNYSSRALSANKKQIVRVTLLRKIQRWKRG